MRVTDFGGHQLREQRGAWDARQAEDAGAARIGVGPLEADEAPGADTVGHTTATASTLAIGASTNGYVNTAGDRDWYAVTLVAGQSYTFTLNGGTLTDPYLELRSSFGGVIGLDDDFGTGVNAQLRWTATQTDTYYINAQAFPASGLTGSYTLSVATSAPASPLDAIDYHYTMPTTAISIWFATTGYTNPSQDATVRNWTQPEIDAVMAALGTYSAITPLTFSVAASQGAATWIFSLADLPGNTLGYFAVGSQYAAFDPTVTDFTAGLTPGGSSWVTVIHEAGHGLGMAHPHDNGAEDYGPDNSEVMQGVTDPFNSLGTFELNQGVFTTMTYNDGWVSAPFGGGPPNNIVGGQATPMALDIALMQQRYGVNSTTGLGNSTYTLLSAHSAYRAIWDNGGADTISYAGTAAATIDLRAATLLNQIGGGGYVSFVQGIHGGWTIANGVVIENATGGSGNDTLIGNDAANILTGGAGVDNMSGGLGDDTYNVDNTDDIVTEGASAGTDTVIASVTYNLFTNIENLTLVGSGLEIHGAGNALNNVIIGDNAVNSLQGFGGSDSLTGNGGNDALNGGLGVDTAGYSIASTSASWTRNPNGTWTITGQGNDTLTSVEYLDFTDRDVFLDRAASTFTGDGTSDIIVRNTNTGGLAAWFVSGGSVTAGGLGTVDSSWQIQGVGDFNGDGRDDIFWRNSSGGLAAWFMNGTASTGAVLGSTTNAWSVETVGDFNGDGTDDVLWRDSGGGLAAWFFNNGVATGGVLGQATSNWVIEGAADFNGDGRDDILWRDTSSGALAAWFMDGTTATGGVLGIVDAGWSVQGFGDLNGDGRDDILWRNSADALAAWFMNGTSATGGVLGVVDGGWNVESIGDYNGDGRDDILWRNGDTIAAWYMNGTVSDGVILSSLSQDWIINPYG